MAADLQACKHDVLAEYFRQQSHSGAIVGGVLGGAVGGAIGGALDADSSSMKSSDIDPAVEQCMKKKGYIGTSEN